MKIAEIRAKFPMYSDLSDRDLVKGLHQAHYQDLPYGDFLRQIDFNERSDPTREMGASEKFNAGVGKAFYDISQGAQQLFGGGESAEETRNRRELDAPLMRTGAGIGGNIAGNITALAPIALIPGANTVAGAGALGLTAAALQPAESVGERATNMAVGGALGAGTQAIAGPGARALGEWGANRESQVLNRQTQNSVRDSTLREAQAAGYVVPPSAVNQSGMNKVLESVAGKAAVGQEAALRNQEVTNSLARKALGFPEGTPLSEQALRQYRHAVGRPYREVSALSPQAAQNLEALKNARHQATAYNRHYTMSADPNSLNQARHFQQQAEALEQSLEQIAQQSGRPQLVDALRDSRRQIAMSWDVEKALNVGTGDVSAKALGRSLDKGRPMTGELATAGRFAEAFGPYARDAASIPTPGVSKVGALASALMGGGGMAAAGPAGVIAGAVPFVAPPAARSAVLSGPYQRMMAQPDYSVGPVARTAAALNDPETQRRAALLARSLALPAIPQAVNE
jgi:hypothetical protein